MGGVVNLVDPSTGQVRAFDQDADGGAIIAALRGGWEPESARGAAAREVSTSVEQKYSGMDDKASAAAGSLLSGATAGLSDVAIGALDPATASEQARQRAANPVTSTVANVTGAVAPALLSGGAGAAGSVARATPSGALAAASGAAGAGRGIIGKAAISGAEGAVSAAGSALGEAFISEDPVTVDRIMSAISTPALLGFGVGAAAGTLAKGVEIGLGKAGRALKGVSEVNAAPAIDEVEDLSRLDFKELSAVEKAEKARIAALQVEQRAQIVDEIGKFRQELNDKKVWLAVAKGNEKGENYPRWFREAGKVNLDADKRLDKILRNPKDLAEQWKQARSALRQQEHALEIINSRSDELRVIYAADTSGQRAAALADIPQAIERNRALQASLEQIASDVTTPKLQAIADARDALRAAAGAPKSLAEKVVQGGVFSAVSGAVAALPIPGSSVLAPLIGAHASSLVTDKVFGRLGKALGETESRISEGVGKFFEAGSRAARIAPPVATRVLSRISFGEKSSNESRGLSALYKARAAEIRELVAPGPTGEPMVRPHIRQRIAEGLNPIATKQPILADRLETAAVRRVEFLARKLPKRPEIGAMQFGPDNWEPSEMDMRKWARFVAAAEDPNAIIDRLVSGVLTPEDAETMHTLFPESLADITRRLLENLPAARKSISPERKVSLSILTGVPVDPALDPRILTVLQSQYTVEPEAPKAQAQFGSVRSTEKGTPSEQREQRMSL